MPNMIKMWNITIKNNKTGEQSRISIYGHNGQQARRNAIDEYPQLFTDPFANISIENIEYAGFEIAHPYHP